MRKFPKFHIAFKSSKTVKWDTAVQTAGSGRVKTLTHRFYPRWTISSKFVGLTDDERRKLMGFVNQCKGSYTPFLWLDPEDNHVGSIELPAVSPGIYQCVMMCGSFVQPAHYVENVKVYVDGVLQSENTYKISDGLIKFDSAPASSSVVNAEYDYYWKVMLSGDGIEVEQTYNNVNNTATVKMVTVE